MDCLVDESKRISESNVYFDHYEALYCLSFYFCFPWCLDNSANGFLPQVLFRDRVLFLKTLSSIAEFYFLLCSFPQMSKAED